ERTVSRRSLAQPSPDIVERTWASLADGTPLVTGAPRGDGTVVLFHITPEATWSNLPISGSFVEMLRRVVQLSRNQGSVETNQEENGGGLAPYRMISATGELVPPPPDARPLPASGAAEVNIDNPPGLYGSEDGVVAHNLFEPGAELAPLQRPEAPVAMTQASYAYDESRDLKGPLMAAALLLMLLDTLAVLWMGGLFTRRPKRAAATATTIVALAAAGLFLFAPQPASAQEQQVAEADAIDAISVTRIAYVVTGDSSVDSVSRAGIEGLSRFLTEKTALEPGEPAGVDLAQDELSFYP